MIDMHVHRLEQLDNERYRLSIMYGHLIVHNVVAMLRDGRVHAVYPPAFHTKENKWVQLVTWSRETRERIREIADDAITHGRIAEGTVL